MLLDNLTGESGVKKLSKTVDSAVGSIGGILVDHLQPSLQAAAFKLNELHSLAKCTRQLEPLGLQVSILPPCASSAIPLHAIIACGVSMHACYILVTCCSMYFSPRWNAYTVKVLECLHFA